MCYKKEVRDKKLVLFLTIGGIFILIGFVGGNSNKIHLGPKENPKISISLSTSSNVAEVLSSKSSNIKNKEFEPLKALDGDTIETSSGEKIRYLGINSPEKGEPFFEEASELNQNLVLDKIVTLEFDIQKKDRYGRTLAYVFAGNELVNLEMVRNGLAVSQTIQPNIKYQDQILEVQKEARNKCLGIWAGLCGSKSNNKNNENCIKIASINSDAAGNDNQNKNGEWVEIKNSCLDSISLKGWILKDSSASNKYSFKKLTLSANKSIILYSGCGQDSQDSLYWQCPEGKYSIWNNGGDSSFLYNEKGILVSDYQY